MTVHTFLFRLAALDEISQVTVLCTIYFIGPRWHLKLSGCWLDAVDLICPRWHVELQDYAMHIPGSTRFAFSKRGMQRRAIVVR